MNGSTVMSPRRLPQPTHHDQFDGLLLTSLTQPGGLCAKSATDTPVLVVVTSGSARIVSGDTTLAVPAGHIAVFASGAATRVATAEATTAVAIGVPAAVAGVHLQAIRALHGHLINAERGTAALVLHLAEALRAAGAHDHGPRSHATIAPHIVGLIGAMCAENSPSHPTWRDDLLGEAIDFIESHLADIDLSPETIASHVSVSTRTLHRVFGHEGLTVSGWIRSRRLERVKADLASAATRDFPVSKVGATWGLWDAAHFSRIFKAQFGVTPTEYRRRALTPVAQAA